MSGYLRNLAALTLNRIEPVQPRLASRFETPIVSDTNGLDVVHESKVQPIVKARPSEVTATDSPVAQKTVTIPAENKAGKESAVQDQPKIFEPNEFKSKKSGSPDDKQNEFLVQRDVPVDGKIDIERENRIGQSETKPVVQVFTEVQKDVLPTESRHTFVEQVREHFTQTIQHERVIKEVAALGADKKTAGLETPTHPAPVKPASIAVQSGQVNKSNQPGAQAVRPTHSGLDVTPLPTIQVTIGRIEIRATQVTDKPTAKPRSASATMSLDDYLKQRNGGKA